MRNFNWHYKTAHVLGESHVRDTYQAKKSELQQRQQAKAEALFARKALAKAS